MQEIINTIIENLKELESSSPQILSLIIGMSVIVLESMIPILPLAVFIALNMLLFGNFIGFTISWIATCLGCFLSFYIVRKGLREPFEKKSEQAKTIKKIMKIINKISLPNFVLIISMPFMPAFAINIAAGLSKIDAKKFIASILISKLIIVYFWGFIGTTFLESVSDPLVILQLLTLLLIAYIVSKQIMKKYKID
ncbi:MAG: VTT domain-containing protein [Bacilli bacterium]